MAHQFRTVRCDMWRKDEWFADLPADAKLIWIYSFTNESTSPAGIYRIALRTIANETGVPLPRVREIVAEFSRAGKLYYEDGILWPVTMRKHQVGELKSTDNLLVRIRADLADLPAAPIVDRYSAHYAPPPAQGQPLPAPSALPSEALATPSAAPSEGLRLTDTLTDTPVRADGVDAGAAAPAVAGPPAAPPSAEEKAVAQAARAYENQIGLISGGHQAAEMVEMIGRLQEHGVLGWWQIALDIACDNNARKWAYVRAILDKSLASGISPGGRKHPPLRSNGNGTGKRADPAAHVARRKEIDQYDNAAALARI